MNKSSFFYNAVYTLCFILFTVVSGTTQCAIADLAVTNTECDENDNFTVEINFNFTNTGDNGFQVLGNGNNYGTFEYANLPITIENLIGNCEIEFEFIIRDVDDPTCAAFVEYGTVCCNEDCAIEIVDFETTECTENVNFGFSFDLEHEFTGSNGFTVYINDEELGTFSYEDLPLDFNNLTSENDGLNEIKVCDVDNSECCATLDFLNPCVCGFTNITSEIVDCNSVDSTFYVNINFDHVATNDSFQMGYSNNGTNTFLGTFAYSDLPVLAGPIVLSENDQEILIVDTENFFCFSSAYLGIVEDCTIECQLFNLFGEASICEEGEYFIDLEFEAKDIEGSTFEVFVDGTNYGSFEYGETFYTVGPIPSNCDQAPTLVIEDSGLESCSDFFNFSDPICCESNCNFTALEIESICNPTTTTLNGSFVNEGTMLSAFYFVQFLGTSYGPFPYGDFMFSIDVPLLANGEYEISINDSMDPECQISTSFTSQCDDEPCGIFEVFAEPTECEDDLFFVDVEFGYGGTVSDSFTIAGNGIIYGTYAYGSTFYTIGPLEGDCETIYEFVVSDQIFEGCNSFYAFDEPVCCSPECALSEIELSEVNCANSISISGFTLNFVHENTPSEMFILTINETELGTFFYSELPITFENDLPTELVIVIQDSENLLCTAEEEIEIDCSDAICSITEVNTTFIECSEDNNSYFVSLGFDNSFTSDSFNLLTLDSVYGTYGYDQLPITIGPLTVGTTHNFLVSDNMIDDCLAEFEVFLEQCETSTTDDKLNLVSVTQSIGQIDITNKDSGPITVTLYSLSGIQTMKSTIPSMAHQRLNTLNVPTGLYLLNLSNKSDQKTIKVLVY
ncbi:MAG: T9SS type A sorting domain-containing protein [Saprospiraceae bacterium]|nr:T9SS type A sorting domain-containing protein [Saprospiraceae bacterium]